MLPVRATLPSFLITLVLAMGVLVASRAEAGCPTPSAIYRCEVGDVITFSDRPCAVGTPLYQPDTSRVSTYSPPAATLEPERPAPARKPSRKRSQSNADSPAKRAQECSKLRSELDEIRSRMRAGYGVKEGERLRERQSRLRARWRDRHCR